MKDFLNTKRERVCDINCEQIDPVKVTPIDGSNFFKDIDIFEDSEAEAKLPLILHQGYCCDPFKDKKELFEVLDRLRKNNSESKDFENNEMEKILYRMFPLDYSLHFKIDGIGVSESGLSYYLVALRNYPNTRVPSTVDSDGMLISEENPDEYKDGFSRERKLIKDHIRDLLKQIAILNSDIYDLSIFNKTTIDEYWKEKEEVGRLKEEVWKYYTGEHNEGDYEKGHIYEDEVRRFANQTDEMKKASHEPCKVVNIYQKGSCNFGPGSTQNGNVLLNQ